MIHTKRMDMIHNVLIYVNTQKKEQQLTGSPKNDSWELWSLKLYGSDPGSGRVKVRGGMLRRSKPSRTQGWARAEGKNNGNGVSASVLLCVCECPK